MTKHYRLWLLCVVAILSFGTVLGADKQGDKTKTQNKLIGTWKMVSAKYGGGESDLPKRMTSLKHVTPTHFMWVRINPETAVATGGAGGTYSLKDGKYTETVTYGFGQGFVAVRDKSHSFTYKIKGNRWEHVGSLASGLKIEEIWERVEEKK